MYAWRVQRAPVPQTGFNDNRWYFTTNPIHLSQTSKSRRSPRLCGGGFAALIQMKNTDAEAVAHCACSEGKKSASKLGLAWNHFVDDTEATSWGPNHSSGWVCGTKLLG